MDYRRSVTQTHGCRGFPISCKFFFSCGEASCGARRELFPVTASYEGGGNAVPLVHSVYSGEHHDLTATVAVFFLGRNFGCGGDCTSVERQYGFFTLLTTVRFSQKLERGYTSFRYVSMCRWTRCDAISQWLAQLPICGFSAAVPVWTLYPRPSASSSQHYN